MRLQGTFMMLSKSSFVPIILAICHILLLSACSNVAPKAPAVVSVLPEPQQKIVKSPNDKRLYKSIILDNQLEVILVSDPTIEKSAAALSVNVGSFQEPIEFGGLA